MQASRQEVLYSTSLSSLLACHGKADQSGGVGHFPRAGTLARASPGEFEIGDGYKSQVEQVWAP